MSPMKGRARQRSPARLAAAARAALERAAGELPDRQGPQQLQLWGRGARELFAARLGLSPSPKAGSGEPAAAKERPT